jgi:predicted extracellular nuclease
VAIVVGDLNANHGEGAYEKLANRADGTKRLYDAPLNLKLEDRYSYIYRNKKDLLDHLMVNPEHASAIEGVRILHINSGTTTTKRFVPGTVEGTSDHDPLLASIRLTLPPVR